MIQRMIKDIDNQIFESFDDIKLKLNDYRSKIKKGLHLLSRQDLDKMKESFDNFINVELIFFSDTYPPKIYRISNNKKIVGDKTRLQKVSQLIGPPLGISKFGRCNLEGESVFYAALEFETAIWETQPEVGDLITVSIWKIRDGQKLDTYHVFHPSKTNLNKESLDAYKAFLKAVPTSYGKIKDNNPDLEEIINEYFSFLTDEFMKIVNYKEPENYLISALFSSRLLQTERDDNGFKIEAISYPSVKKDYGVTNLAILNSLVFEKLELEKIVLMEIAETNYTKNAKRDELIKINGFQLEFDEFDIVNDKIIYNSKKEIEQVAEQHSKWINGKYYLS